MYFLNMIVILLFIHKIYIRSCSLRWVWGEVWGVILVQFGYIRSIWFSPSQIGSPKDWLGFLKVYRVYFGLFSITLNISLIYCFFMLNLSVLFLYLPPTIHSLSFSVVFYDEISSSTFFVSSLLGHFSFV